MIAIPPPEHPEAKKRQNKARSMGAAEAVASLVATAGLQSKTIRPEEIQRQRAAAEREKEEVSGRDAHTFSPGVASDILVGVAHGGCWSCRAAAGHPVTKRVDTPGFPAFAAGDAEAPSSCPDARHHSVSKHPD